LTENENRIKRKTTRKRIHDDNIVTVHKNVKNNGQYKITKCGHNQTGIYFLNNRTTSGRIAILQTKKS